MEASLPWKRELNFEPDAERNDRASAGGRLGWPRVIALLDAG